MALFQFADLINKYSVDCTLITVGKGKYEAGEPVAGESVSVDIRAAVISMLQSRIYRSGGHLTEADRELYILKEKDTIDLESGDAYYLEHNGKKYKVEASGLYGEDYADFNNYTLKRVDSF